MEERMNPSDELAGGPFDPEMTEPDEANAPDDTGRTAEPSEISGETTDRATGGDAEEVGI